MEIRYDNSFTIKIMKNQEEGGSVLILPKYASLRHISLGNLICQLPWPNVRIPVAFTYTL